MLAVLSLLLLPAFAESPKIWVLKAFQSENTYFHPAGEGLCFAKRGEKYVSNALATGEVPSSKVTARSTRATTANWFDPSGNPSSIGVVQRQLLFQRAYQDFIQEKGPPVPDRCDLSACRFLVGDKEVFVPSVAAHGVLDGHAMAIPFYRLALEYDRERRRFESYSGPETEFSAYWKQKLEEAGAAVFIVRDALAGFEYLPPKPPPKKAARRSETPLGGLEFSRAELPVRENPGEIGEKPVCFSVSPVAVKSPPESVDIRHEGFSRAVQELGKAERVAWSIFEDVAALAEEVLARAKKE